MWCDQAQVAAGFRAEVRKAFRMWDEQSDGCTSFPMYLWGEPGTGKTCAMACLYRVCKSSVKWLNAVEFVALVSRCRREGQVVREGSPYTVGEAHIWRVDVMQPDVLFVDDIGIREPSAAQYEILFQLVDCRRNRPTFYTSNIPPAKLQQLLDGRIASRLLRGSVVHFTGQDRREYTRKRVEV